MTITMTTTMCKTKGAGLLRMLLQKAPGSREKEREREEMELQLNPVFYLKVDSTSRGTLAVLPSTKRTAEKVVVGDETGVITCFTVKKGNANMVFKTLPGDKISCLQLGGGEEGGVSDKIFVSSEAEVKGYSRKGKQFLNFDTNLTEPISSMSVEGNHLLVCGPYVYNHYTNCQDTDYFLSSDHINDVLCLPPTTDGEPLSCILACQDCSLRLIKGSKLQYEVEVAGPPMCMRLMGGGGGGGGGGGNEVLYGTQTGRIGLVRLTPEEPHHCWDMLNERKYGGVSCLSTFDLTGDGVEEMIVGREDGVVEVYSMDDSDQPRLRYTHMLNESVTGVAGGRVGSAHYEEIIVCTFSGKVIGLTTEPLSQQTLSQEMQDKLKALQKEVESLEAKVGVAKEQYQKTVAAAQGGSDAVSALPAVQVNDRFSLNQDEAWYTLTIELQSSIEMVVLQSDVPIDLQEVDKSTAVVSHSPPDPENGNYLLATFRCHDTNRLEVKVRSIEGQQGQLQAYITPRLEPKTCCLRQYPIKPLSLHQRIHSFDEERPCNVLRVIGGFSLGQAHSWVALCLPDVPERPPVEDHTSLFFKSTFIYSQLSVSYRKGEIVFRSDNMSTISVLREVLSKETALKKITVRITHELDESSVEHMLQLIHPQLEVQLMLAKNVQLIEGLQEIEIHEESPSSCLSPQCQYILENASAMQEELKQQPAMIERLYALVTDLLIDRASFKGENAQSRVPELMELLDNCDLNSLITFFKS